jgi:hypothetical protein
MDRRRLSAYANLGGYTDGMGYINQPNVSMELRRMLLDNLMCDNFFLKLSLIILVWNIELIVVV